jgi:hypothetical protein
MRGIAINETSLTNIVDAKGILTKVMIGVLRCLDAPPNDFLIALDK